MLRSGAHGSRPTSRRARTRRCSWWARRPATAARESPASHSPPSATIVQRVLAELGLTDLVLLWNVVPTHPGTARSNRTPSHAEVSAGRVFADELADGRRVLAVGRIAHAALGGQYVRHPSHGGAAEFAQALRDLIG